MGYRSDVAYAVHFPDQDALVAFAATIRLGGDTYELGALNECCVTPYEGGVYLTLFEQSVKWYEMYPEVQAHERILAKAHEAGHSYKFIRIGEEDGDNVIEQMDTEDEADFWELIDFNRSISHSFSETTLSSILNPDQPATEDSNG